MAITDFLLGDQARTEASIAKLQSRVAVERAEVDACTRRRNSALLAIDEADGSTSAKDADAALVSLADARKAVEKTEGALSAANERLAGLQRNDESAMSRKKVEKRTEAKRLIVRFASEREQAAHSLRTAIIRYADDRKVLANKSAEIVRLMRDELGVEPELRGAALDQAGLDAHVAHLFSELGLPGGLQWNSPNEPRPELTAYMASGTAVIKQLVGDHG